MNRLPNLDTKEPYVLRQEAERFKQMAKECRQRKIAAVPFGAVDVTPRTLELWAADCERRANLLEGGKKTRR